MLVHQLFAIIIYSCWHYGRVFYENQKDLINFKQALSRVLLILLMAYLMFSWTLLCCAIIVSKFFYDTIVFLIRDLGGGFFDQNSKYKHDLYDAQIGIICCLVYLLG